MTFRFIAQNAEEWPLAWMCDALEVSESGHHAWAGYDRVRLHSSLGYWTSPQFVDGGSGL